MHASDPCVLATTGPLDGPLALAAAGIGLVLVAAALALLATRRSGDERVPRAAGLSLTVAVLVGALAFGATAGAAPAQASDRTCATTVPGAPHTTTSTPGSSAPSTSAPATSAPATSTPAMTTPDTASPAPTTPEPTTPEPTTPEPTTPEPTTPEPTTPEPTTPEPTTCSPDPLGLTALTPGVERTSAGRAGVSNIPTEVYDRLVDAGAVFRLTDATHTSSQVHWTEVVDGVTLDRGTQTVERERTFWSENFVVTEGLVVPTAPFDSRVTSDEEFAQRVADSATAAGVTDPGAATHELVAGTPERTLTLTISVTDSCGEEQTHSYPLPVD